MTKKSQTNTKSYKFAVTFVTSVNQTLTLNTVHSKELVVPRITKQLGCKWRIARKLGGNQKVCKGNNERARTTESATQQDKTQTLHHKHKPQTKQTVWKH